MHSAWPHAAPFALLVGDSGLVSDAGLSARLRRMGLRPEPIAVDAENAGSRMELRLSFGALRVAAGPLTPALADECAPTNPSVATAGTMPPGNWSDRALMFVPERGARDSIDAPEAEQRFFDRRFFEMLVLLIDTFDADFLYWSPARLWSRADLFRTAITEMLDSGMPPVLHLVAFLASGPDMPRTITTRGLSHFAGQDIVALPPEGMDTRDVVRRLARLALDMMINGPVRHRRLFPGLTSGEMLVVDPQQAVGEEPARLHVSWQCDGG